MKNLIIVGAVNNSMILKNRIFNRLKMKFGIMIIIHSLSCEIKTALDRCRCIDKNVFCYRDRLSFRFMRLLYCDDC